jgi:hypothetical protein
VRSIICCLCGSHFARIDRTRRHKDPRNHKTLMKGIHGRLFMDSTVLRVVLRPSGPSPIHPQRHLCAACGDMQGRLGALRNLTDS